MSLPMFMTPSEIQKNIGMPEDTVWNCIGSGTIGYSEFNNIVLIETSDIISLIRNRKVVVDSNAHDSEYGYYEQDAVEIE
ncbi:hypothetical protein NNJEOMEG_00628 [Fundidesulfovibrio magnetotacticus]|uniref:Helix-turn-helix domain-containing protein n=1 Tax=Fundidesulfovibrio magnetotacticus TaxID=2730080 RepID=A0A6V8LQH6_9BACT|nr:hypothetical protein [Fundidesulfovibrio magnetotacticus]GFK92801.1 hypothetical protein NNJEOMEG_00628 [Fundidesulfovibrio magnetotacticus]